MSIVAVTPADAASDPRHPDHARWVKERTLALEIAHAQRMGGSLRDAEANNARLLARMDALARRAPAASEKKKPRKSREERIRDRGVVVTAPRKRVAAPKLSPCGRCGTCRRCMRERRILDIIQRSKGDRAMLELAWDVTRTVLAAQARAGRFAEMSPSDANRVVIAKAESVCERSVRWLGPWI